MTSSLHAPATLPSTCRGRPTPKLADCKEKSPSAQWWQNLGDSVEVWLGFLEDYWISYILTIQKYNSRFKMFMIIGFLKQTYG